MNSTYLDFKFVVSSVSDDRNQAKQVAGFSEVCGLETKAMVAEPHTQQNDKHVKVPGIHRFGEVVLKRGIISKAFADWLMQGWNAGAKQDLRITLLDENKQPVFKWRMKSTMPIKWMGPSFSAKGSDVAVEEVVLSHEGIEVQDSGDKECTSPTSTLRFHI